MKIENFHHVIRAAAAITNETAFVVGGGQAILARFPNAPAALLRSQELDIYPKFRPGLSDLIEGSLGADSAFHGAFGYHADGVGPETARLPPDRENRAPRVQAPTTGMATAICPEANDLVASKLIALWRQQPGMDPWLCETWERLLAGPVDAMRAVVMADTREAERLRHSMPFAGVLGNRERMALRRAHGGVTHP